MKLLRLYGRLAVASLLLSVAFSAAQAQVFNPIHRPVYTTYPAYTGTSSGVKLGLRAGVNVAGWSGEAAQNLLRVTGFTSGAMTKETKPGFHAGLYATIPVGRHFAIEPGVLYSEKGVRMTGTLPVQQLEFLNAQATATARMAYLDVPVLLKAYVTRGFYLYAGPQASYLVSSKMRVSAGALGVAAYTQDFDLKDQFRALDFGVVSGLGYQFDSGLGLSAGYDYGLSSLDKNNRFAAQNRVIKASVSFSF